MFACIYKKLKLNVSPRNLHTEAYFSMSKIAHNFILYEYKICGPKLIHQHVRCPWF